VPWFPNGLLQVVPDNDDRVICFSSSIVCSIFTDEAGSIEEHGSSRSSTFGRNDDGARDE
jgi:hypothetical protein